jgi:hypothetical protein
MNVQTTMNLKALDSEITTLIANDDISSNSAPLTRSIELLVDVSIEAKRRMTNHTVQSEVFESFFERFSSS